MGSHLCLFAVVFDESDALGNFGHAVVPVVLVFDGDIPLKALRLQFIEAGLDVGHTRPEGHVVGAGARLVQVFEVAADDPAFEVSEMTSTSTSYSLPSTT